MQGVSVLSDLEQRKRSLRPEDRTTLQALKSLFLYLHYQESFVRSGRTPPAHLFPKGVGNQMFFLTARLTRHIHQETTRVFIRRATLSRSREEIIFFLVVVFSIGVFSFLLSNLVESRAKKAIQIEISLLDQFILTGDLVRDWKASIRQLLARIPPSIRIKSLFVLFLDRKSGTTCEIFWMGLSPDSVRAEMESQVRKIVGSTDGFSGLSDLRIEHEVVQQGGFHDHFRGDPEILTKTLSLEEAGIHGVVGVGVDRSISVDSIQRQVIEGVLSSILNIVGSVRAISSYTEKLEYFAARDPLTNLYNQRVFWDLLNYEAGRSERHRQSFVLMMIDLDDFKRINDSYGHKVGDRCLELFAVLLRQLHRTEDIIFRYGGDEFCTILPETGIEQGWAIATRLLEEVGRMVFSVEGTEGGISVSISIGLAAFPQNGQNPRELYLVADNMMYKAKRAGKNQCMLPSDSDLAETFRHEGDIYLMLRKSVQEERFLPYFQPIRDSVSGQIFAYEVLVRLPNPDYPEEIIAAGEFIEVMERTGLVMKMDTLVRRKAFEIHQRTNCRNPLFINLSPGSLSGKGNFTDLRSLVRDSGVDPHMVVFEITEREMIESLESLVKFMHEMRNIGVRFAIDDFGSGFASFDYVRDLPVNFVKIGGDMVRNLSVRGHVDELIVSSLVQISERLDLLVVAETIESEEVLLRVSSLGVPLVQGYYVGRPSPDLS
jgi:diguanylate cyclase (GGDEF)-like protein